MMKPPVVVTTESPMEEILKFWSAAEAIYDKAFAEMATELSDKATHRVESIRSSEGHTFKVAIDQACK